MHSKSANIIIPTAERSVRNCCWSGDLWAHYIRILEYLQRPKENIKEVVERGLVMVAIIASLDETHKVCDAFCRYEVRQINPEGVSISMNA